MGLLQHKKFSNLKHDAALDDAKNAANKSLLTSLAFIDKLVVAAFENPSFPREVVDYRGKLPFRLLIHTMSRSLLQYQLYKDLPRPKNPTTYAAQLEDASVLDITRIKSSTPCRLIIFDPPALGSFCDPSDPNSQPWSVHTIRQTVIDATSVCSDLVHREAIVCIILRDEATLHQVWGALCEGAAGPRPACTLTFSITPYPSIKAGQLKVHDSSLLYVLVASRKPAASVLKRTTSRFFNIPANQTLMSRFSRPYMDCWWKKNGYSGPVLCQEQRPYDLPVFLIRMYSHVGDCVLSLCSGSGTDAIAALSLCRGVVCVEKSVENLQGMSLRVRAFAAAENARRYHQTMLGALEARKHQAEEKAAAGQHVEDPDILNADLVSC